MGDYGEWIKCERAICRNPDCKSKNVEYRTLKSSCGGYEDYNYKCLDCGKTWWIDGIDS